MKYKNASDRRSVTRYLPLAFLAFCLGLPLAGVGVETFTMVGRNPTRPDSSLSPWLSAIFTISAVGMLALGAYLVAEADRLLGKARELREQGQKRLDALDKQIAVMERWLVLNAEKRSDLLRALRRARHSEPSEFHRELVGHTGTATARIERNNLRKKRAKKPAAVGPSRVAFYPNMADAIEKTPGVCGGAARVKDTRIPVWQLIEARESGASEAELLLDHPRLTARDLVAAWEYAEEHPDEIASEISRNEVA